jgi:uncharacterized protein (TIGR02217 family)
VSFVDQRFPTDISRDAEWEIQFATEVVRLDAGTEQRNQLWDYPLHLADLGSAARKGDRMEVIRNHFYAMAGRAHSFRVKNWHDFKSCDPEQSLADTDQLMYQENDVSQAVGDGVETDFWLAKTYTLGAQSSVRLITKAVSGSVVVSLDSVSQPTGWSLVQVGDHYLVRFTAAPGVGVVPRAGFEFDLEMRFDTDALRWRGISAEWLEARIPLVELKAIP